MCTRPRFDKEVQVNSEMGYWIRYHKRKFLLLSNKRGFHDSIVVKTSLFVVWTSLFVVSYTDLTPQNNKTRLLKVFFPRFQPEYMKNPIDLMTNLTRHQRQRHTLCLIATVYCSVQHSPKNLELSFQSFDFVAQAQWVWMDSLIVCILLLLIQYLKHLTTQSQLEDYVLYGRQIYQWKDNMTKKKNKDLFEQYEI